jgi:hypothetical protein
MRSPVFKPRINRALSLLHTNDSFTVMTSWSVKGLQQYSSLGQDQMPTVRANQARLQTGVLAYNLLHMIRQFSVWREKVKRSVKWLIKRFIKVRARVSYHVQRW